MIPLFLSIKMITLKLLKFFIFALVYHECHGEESVDQSDNHIGKFEGRSVDIPCKYKTASPQPELFWYIQRANDFPKYILRRNKYGGEDTDPQFQERFHSKVSSDSVPLTIRDVRVSDSAVYYCALTRSGTDKLIFGTGTNLIVETKERKAPVYYKIEDSCLATDFTNHSAVTFKDVPAARYSGKEDEKFFSSFYLGGVNTCPENDICKGSSGQGSDIEYDEKVNYLSLGLFWLRILFLKTVVFNVLMTFKAWMI